MTDDGRAMADAAKEMIRQLVAAFPDRVEGPRWGKILRAYVDAADPERMLASLIVGRPATIQEAMDKGAITDRIKELDGG